MLSIKWYACHPGTHPVEDPPEEHLLESSATGECVDAQSNAEVRVAESGTEEPTAVIAASEPNTRTSTAEANSQATHPSKTPKRKSGRACKPKKKPRLCDVVEQSNEQMRQMQDYMQNNSTTPEARYKEKRRRPRIFSPHVWYDVANYDGHDPNATSRSWSRISSTKPGICSSKCSAKLQFSTQWHGFWF